ncbi:hemagglutinin repeat-containing protein [Cupriavidus pampae]
MVSVVLPRPAVAQIVADPKSDANRPTVISTPNGLPQVNITRPSGAGVSTNHYSQFDVNKAGAILNNSPTVVNTQQAGYINGNPNLQPGGSARIIVNQVTSTLPSQLRGYLEVAGPRAGVVVANPNGIFVDGAGFINTTRATLTTGLPVYGGLGSLDAFRVTRGQINIEGAGLNVAGVDQVDVIARAVKANAVFYANNLNVVSGANEVDYSTIGAKAITGTGAVPPAGIDVALLGGMYANKIILASTELGVGVSLRGVAAAQVGDFTLTSEGKIILGGHTNASGNLSVVARDGIDNSGTTYAKGTIGVQTDGTLTNSGTLAAQQWLGVNAQNVASTGTLAAGMNADGTSVGNADLALSATGALSARGRNSASGNAAIRGASVSLAGSQTAANGDLTVSGGAVDLSGAKVQAGGAITASAGALNTRQSSVSGNTVAITAQSLDNTSGQIEGTQLAVQTTGDLINVGGTLKQTGQTDTTITAGGKLDNTDGTIAANGQNLTVTAASLTNDRGQLSHAGSGALTITSQSAASNVSGAIQTNGVLVARLGSLNNAGGTVASQKALSLAVQGALDNTNATLHAEDGLTLQADGKLTNTGGRIESANTHDTLSVVAGSIDNAGGQVLGGKDVKLGVASLSNLGGAVKANQDVAVAGALSGSGTMIAGRDLTLNVAGDYTNDAANQLHANGNLKVAATGTLTNTGTLAAAGAVTVSGANVVNAASADINSTTTTVTAGNVLSNAGRIEGDTVQISSPTTLNTGTVIGNNVQVQGTDITNNGASALMAAVQNLDGATLYSAGNLQIARDGTRDASTGLLANQVSTLINRSANIEADGDIDIAANQVSNTRTSIVTTAGTPTQTAAQTLVLWQAGLTDFDRNMHASLTFPGWTWNTTGAPVSTPQTNALRSPITVTVDKADVKNLDTTGKTLSFVKSPIEEYVDLTHMENPKCDIDTGICTRDIATRPTQYYQSIQDNGSTYSITLWPDWDPNIHIRPDEVKQANFGHDYNEISRTTITTTATDQLVSATNAAKIQAAGNIRIHSNNGNILNQSSTMAAGGNLIRVAANGTIQDVGTVLQQTVTTQDTSTFYWHQRTGSSEKAQVVAFPSAPQAPTTVAALPAVATANQNVQAAGQNITIASVNTVGTAVAASTVKGVVPTVSTPQGGISNFTLPTNGLYRFRTAPGDTYLVATDPRFTQYTNFISSDYMLGALGLDPQKTQKRLGDGFYEEKLLRDQITQLTGKTFLNGYTDQLEEYKALMNNGVTYAKAFDLTPGIGLTDAQMQQLTTDMVWMVSQDVTLPDGTTQSVLVPKVYLAQGNAVDLNSTGALVAGNTVSINATGTVDNSGSIVGNLATQVVGTDIINRCAIGGAGTTVVSATQDVRNLGGRIGGQDVVVAAGRDIVNDAQTITNTTTLANGNSASATGIGAVGTIAGTNSVAMLAGRDITMAGGSVSAGNNALLAAGRDLNIGTAQLGTTQDATAHGGQDYLHSETVTNAASTINAGGSVTAVAGRDATLTGSIIDAGSDAALIAGRNTIVTAAIDTRTQDSRAFSNKASQFTQSSYDETAQGSSVHAGNSAVLGAGQAVAATILEANGITPVQSEAGGRGNLAILRSGVSTGSAEGGGGTAKLAAAGDITIGTVTEQHSSDTWSKTSSSGFLSKTQTTTETSQQHTVAVGSLVSADSVTASAGRDLSVVGSSIAGSGDVSLHADRNLTIGAAENTSSSTTSQETRTSGLFSSGGASVTIGRQQVNQTQTEQSTTHTGSVIGSVGGNVNLSAGEGYTQAGSTVTALQGDVDIRAKTVDITTVTDSARSDQETHFMQSGLTIAVSNPIIAAAQTAAQMAKAQGETSDPRMKALAGASAGLAGKNAYDAVSKDPQAAGGISVSVTVGASKSDSTQTQTSTTAVGSTVNAGGNVSIRATGDGKNSNINIIGSDIKAGNDLLLKADNEVNLQAAENTAEQHSTSKSVSGGVGVAVSVGSKGFAFGVTANAAAGRGNADGNDVTWTNSHATAGNTLTIESAGDTNIRGGVASGNQVVANVGGNLNMESLQDTSTYHSKDQSASGSVTVGIGFSGSASISQQKIDSDFASVGEQTAIRAGTGGYQVDVKGNTDLKGAVLAGGSADTNSLSTDTLTVSDIENRAHYSASSIGIGGGFSYGGNSGKSGVGVNQSGQASTAGSGAVPGTDLPTSGGGGQGFSAAPPMVAAASGNASSTTQSGISAGNITIRNETKQQELTGKSAADTIAGVNRDTTNTANSLSPIFDVNEIKADFQIVGALQREAGVYLNNRAEEADAAKKALTNAAKDPDVSPEKLAELQQRVDDLATWGPGGDSRRVMTALMAAASGNVTGSTAQFVQGAAVGYLQGLAAGEVKAIADSLGKGTPEAEAARAALHAIVGCAGAAAASQSCGAGAMGAATASLLGSLLSPTEGMSEGQKRARESLIQSLVAGVAGAVGSNPATAMNGATFEIDNNQLSPIQSGGTPVWGSATPQKPFQTPAKPMDPAELAVTGTPNQSAENQAKPIVQPIVDAADLVGVIVGGILPNPLTVVEGLGPIFSSSDGAPKYVPTPKHDAGGWGTPMDLDNVAAQKVLNNSVQGGKQRYGVSDGKVYEFQPDNVGGWHGYPVPGNEVPATALRALLGRGDITRAEYRKLIKGK